MGEINLDNTGSGSGVTLSSDGTSLLLDGTAVGGGGGADLYAANESSPNAQPSALGANAIAIGNTTKAGTQASHVNAIAIGGSNNTSQPIQATNTFAVAIGAAYYGGVTASSDGSMAIGTGATVASASGSLALGRSSTAAGNAAVSLPVSYASGANSFAAAIANSSSSYGAAATNSIAMGYQAKASGPYSLALGRQVEASGTSATAIGYQANAQGTDNISIGREATTPSWANTSIAIGRNCKTNAKGKIAFGAQAGGIGLGLAQSGMLVIHGRTANATSSVLTSDGSLQGVGTAAYNNQLYLESYAAMAFDGLIVARGQGNVPNTDCAAFKIEGLIRRESNANTTVLVNSATTVINNAPGWGVTLSADTTRGCLAVHVTGSSSANVKWVCTLRTSETIYDSY